MPKKKLDVTPECKYTELPVIIVHKEGKNLEDTKTCYFDSLPNAQKYITRNNFTKKDYQLYQK